MRRLKALPASLGKSLAIIVLIGKLAARRMPALIALLCRFLFKALAILFLIAALAAVGAFVTLHLDEGSGGSKQRGPEPTPRRSAMLERRSFLAELVQRRTVKRQPADAPRSITQLAGRLPLESKVAQLFLWGFPGRGDSAPGVAVSGQDPGGLVILNRNYAAPEQLAKLTAAASARSRHGSNVPPLIVTNQEGGDFSELPDLPPAKAPAELASLDEAVVSAARTARTLKRLGLNGILGPLVDVGVEQGSAIRPRAYSDDPRKVAAYASATVRAYRQQGLFAVAKHFPGLGSASQSTADGPATVGLSLEELKRRDLLPFRAAIAAGVPGIMVGHGLYATDDFVTPASLSAAVMADLLRGSLGYRGVAITDDLASPAITLETPVPAAAIRAVKAGADMVFISGPRRDQQAAYLTVLNAVRSGEIARARVDEAVFRILAAKRALHLIR